MSTQELQDLPKVLRVETGSIFIPYTVEPDNLKEFERYNREVTHLLALIPDEHKDDAQPEDDGFYIRTDNLPALKYAVNNYFICHCFTTIDTVIDEYGEGLSSDEIDALIDKALDLEYEAQVLSDGVYLVREGK